LEGELAINNLREFVETEPEGICNGLMRKKGEEIIFNGMRKNGLVGKGTLADMRGEGSVPGPSDRPLPTVQAKAGPNTTAEEKLAIIVSTKPGGDPDVAPVGRDIPTGKEIIRR